MTSTTKAGRRALRSVAASLVLVAGSGVGAGACLDRPVEPIEPRTTATVGDRLRQSAVDKIDLLLAIDNSASMADKQAILVKAVPDLVRGLVNPTCVNAAGVAAAKQPSSPTEDCATVSGPGFHREFQPVLDIHVGVVTSSLGGHGGDACPAKTKDACDADVNSTNDDHGHLVARADVYAKSAVPTYAGDGFLAWDPEKKLSPPGETSLDAFDEHLAAIVSGVGQIGCGFESQLEGWYRFLVDPEPYQSIAVVNGKATPEGVDQELLRQRADFLRPDSLLAIVMLTDENDTSIKEVGQSYLAAQLGDGNGGAFHLPRARSECLKDPNDPCCKSCGQSQGSCPKDPTCDATNDDTSDPANLRGWDDKRRFGIDFLYPVDRYVQALTRLEVPNRAGELVPNPIFSNLRPGSKASVRDASLVFLAGIVGVPWQDIARTNAAGQPDLVAGLDADGKAVGGFRSAGELGATDSASTRSRWDVILGAYDGSTYRPADPLMREDVRPRTGQNPVTGAALMPPGSPAGANAINGHEHAVAAQGDLQYACVFPLLPGTQRDCVKECATHDCDCREGGAESPLCDANPADSGKPTLQARAKAYPGLRELAVLQGLGKNGIVGSICPKQLDDESRADFGYRPAIGAIIDRLKAALGNPCLPRTLAPDAEGHVPCLVVEARTSADGCDCKGAARQPVSDEHRAAITAAREDPSMAGVGFACFCEITQTSGAAQAACQSDVGEPPLADGKEVDGWCYVDATTTPATGNPALVATCPDTEKRTVRFVGKGAAAPGAVLFITCSQ
jgi:hypothetical protein